MNLKKIISAALSAAVCAGMISGMAVTASAATTTTTLSYVKDETALSTYEYYANCNDTYNLNADGKTALASATAGDTLTIEYDIVSNGTARYRCGIKLYDQQFYVNCHNQTSVNNSFTTTTDNVASCHMNAKFVKDDTNYQTAHVKYVFELADGGTISKVTPSITDGDGTTKAYNAQTVTGNKQVDTIVLNTNDRGSAKDIDYAKLTNFKAVLTTTTADPTPAINDATPYTYTTDSTLANTDAKGFTADITVAQDQASVDSLTWYLKNGTEGNWKELVSGSIPTITNGTAKIGLVVYDLPQGVTADDILAGYTYTTQAIQ